MPLNKNFYAKLMTRKRMIEYPDADLKRLWSVLDRQKGWKYKKMWYADPAPAGYWLADVWTSAKDGLNGEPLHFYVDWATVHYISGTGKPTIMGKHNREDRHRRQRLAFELNIPIYRYSHGMDIVMTEWKMKRFLTLARLWVERGPLPPRFKYPWEEAYRPKVEEVEQKDDPPG